MKSQILTVTVAKPRDYVARNMLDRDSVYRARVETNQRQYRRNEKHRKNFSEYTERFYL